MESQKVEYKISYRIRKFKVDFFSTFKSILLILNHQNFCMKYYSFHPIIINYLFVETDLHCAN